MKPIEGEIVIRCPPVVVFDCVADERNEPRYNPRMRHVRKVTDGPIGEGTQFNAVLQSGRRSVPMDIRFTAFARPAVLGSTTTLASMDIDGTLTFEPVEAGTRLRWSWNMRPKGAMRLAGPGHAVDRPAAGARHLDRTEANARVSAGARST